MKSEKKRQHFDPRKQAISCRERDPKGEGRGEKLAPRSSTNDAWGGGAEAERQKRREMTCLEQTNPREERNDATEKKAQKSDIEGKDVWTKERKEKKDSMLMQSQVFRNSDMKAETEKNATKEDFFFFSFITPQTNFSRLLFLFLPLRRKRFPPGSIPHPPAE